MRNLMTVLALAIFLSGCENEHFVERSTPYCLEETDRYKLTNFIVKCAEAANPKSDEEGEDLVAQCEKTGIRTFCPMTKMCRYEGNGWVGEWTTCEEKKIISSKY